ncbi:hypothetical protein C1H46_040452 [Malus baccata]|uniref:J domain-containing protein n=1 Tax=Malus baccata TaxID=106549 RepID=A0A540KIH2_MALBA|nr:hypothetical protein C1H46_040452 [Malus baccata]
MECNKDEALKAKEVAELKASERDFSGALRFALKARSLYPELDGLPQLLTTLYVHTSAQKGTTGETDHYKVLAVEPLADKGTIRKQYKRLALSLHPDKNKSVGADSAFQIVKEAWNLLSDEDERFLYDQRRSLSYMVERVSDCKSSTAMSQNGFHTFSNYNQSNGRHQWSANYTDPFTTMSWNAFHTFSNYNQSNRKDQWSSNYTDPVTAMRRNGFHTFSNYNQSNGRDQWSASCTNPVTMSQNGYHTSSNYNHSNGRDQRSATRNEPTEVMSQDGFYTSSDYNHSNGMDQRSATPAEPTPMCQNGSHTSSNYKHSNGRDQMSATHSVPTGVTSQDGFYTSHNNHSNGRDQRSATSVEHTRPLCQNDFHTPSNDSRSNRRDQKGATSVKPTTPVCQNDFHTSSNDNHSNGRDQSSASASHTKPIRLNTKPTRRNTKPSRPPSLPKQTFWTVCSSCKMHFEYLKTYLNHHLLCHNCNQGFLALETPAPKVPNLTSSPWISYFQRKGSGQRNRTKKTCAPGSSQTATVNVGLAGNSGVDKSTQDFAGKGQVPGSCACQTASDVRQEFGESKRRHEEEFPNKEVHTCNLDAFKKTDAALASESPTSASSSVPNKEMPTKKRHLSGQEMGMANGGVAMDSVFGPNNGSVGTGSFDVAGTLELNFTRDLPKIQVRSALQGMIQKEISQKLKVWKEAAASKTSFTPKAAADSNQVKEKQKEEAGQRGVKTSVTGCTAFVNPKKSSLANSHVDTDMEQQDTVKMTVPDPDFHDFDKDRTEKSFGSNQVWAIYDEDDAMPRYYAMVHSVISLKPFKLSMNWLNAKTNSEIAPLDWIACGFSKTSGDLRKGKHVVYDHLPSFSHKVVRWTKGKRGAICIYPSKGEVWGLFRNWSPVWNEHTPDDVIQKYDMVQVLEDYNEEQGVKIVPLVKVAGFKTVFRQHWDQSKIMKIPREELFRFSHQVPSISLTGNEGHNAPKGCLELDPAATPLELLQVESEEYEDDMEVTGEGCNGEDPVGLSKTTKEEAQVDNGKVTKETGLIEEAEKKDLADLMKREKERQGPTLLVYSRKCFREDKKKGADC